MGDRKKVLPPSATTQIFSNEHKNEYKKESLFIFEYEKADLCCIQTPEIALQLLYLGLLPLTFCF